MSSLNRKTDNRAKRIVLAFTGVVLATLALSVAPALAAPSWGISLTNTPTTLPRSDERMEYVAKVTNTGDVATSGPVTVSFEMPAGSGETAIKIFKQAEGSETFLPTGWICSPQAPSGSLPATGTCTRSDTLAPGASYPAIGVIARLGKDAPEPTGMATATVSGGGVAAPASDTAQYTFTPGLLYGALPGSFKAAVFDELGNDYTDAGGHPFRAFTTFGFNLKVLAHGTGPAPGFGELYPVENTRDIVVDASRGFVGNALAAPELCPSIAEVLLDICPPLSIVGGTDVYAFPAEYRRVYELGILQPDTEDRPIYSVEPEFGQPAQFAFAFPSIATTYTFVPELRADEGYAISFRTAPLITIPAIQGVEVSLCSFGATLGPENQGLLGPAGKTFAGCKKATDADAYPHPLITNPTRCTGVLSAGLRVDSWEHPEEVKTYESPLPSPTGCELVPFEPEAELVPTNRQADTPTGLDVEFSMDTAGLLDPEGVAQANLDNITVTLPKGMTINAASADGLGACTPAQVKLGSNAPDECPESSKVGSIEIDTPLIRETLRGDVYVAKQNDNPFKAPIGLYMVFSSARDGVTVKIAGKLTPDPVTGQLVSSFVENPEWPFSHLALKFNSGPRSPLINPPQCGTYNIKAEFSPWSAVNPANPTSDEIVTDNSTYTVDKGPNGAPCPPGSLEPKLSAGVTNPVAAAKSPFVFRLSREDGTQRFSEISVSSPAGLTAYLKGIPYCPDVVLAGISTAEETGRAQLANPSCPAASQVGTVLAGAGAGPFPFQAPGKVYLAGPYRGAPVSLVAVTPAVAGPYDLGNVAIRNPLYVDPVTSQVTTTSDPIPTIMHGVKLNVRDIRLSLDRPGFTQAPTNCEPMAVSAKVTGESGATANVQSRFQVGGCENLGFKPKLTMRLFGGTKRGAHPKFRAILTPRPGDANIAAGSVALPHSEFLDQGHIRTVCTRVQFAANQCPPGSVYGEAEATSPLLDNPVKGPVYLRSSNNQLPDLVMALRGPDAQPIEVHVVGRIDSVNGGIRSTFDVVPDQPVTSFTLTMQGGKKGLLVNSRDLCVGKTDRATALFTGQNGKQTKLRPKLQNACKQARKGKKSKKQNAQRRNSR